MRIEIFRRFIYLAIGSSLVLVCSGCWPRPRHGVILRGDFALELNRIPWLKSRDAVYRGEEATCEPDGCAAQPAGPAPRAMAPPMASSGGYNGMDGGDVAQTGYHNEPRFHPVPTRPVFSPRGDLSDLVPRGPLPLPRAFDTSPECAVPIQRQPTGSIEPELIPPPPPMRSAAEPDGKSAARRPASSVPAWVFSPPSPAESSDTGKTAQGGWSVRR